jgi:hypothetical protein
MLNTLAGHLTKKDLVQNRARYALVVPIFHQQKGCPIQQLYLTILANSNLQRLLGNWQSRILLDCFFFYQDEDCDI